MYDLRQLFLVGALTALVTGVGGGCTKRDAPKDGEVARQADDVSTSEKKQKKKKSKKSKKSKKKGKSKADDAPLPPLPDGAIAIVAGHEVPREPFDELLQLQLDSILKRRDDGRVPSGAQRYYRKQISQRLVWQELLRLESEASGVDYDPAELEAYLARTTYDPSTKFLERSLETERSWRANAVAYYRERALLQKRTDLKATPAELDAAYEESKSHFDSPEERVWAAHFLVAIGPRTSVDAKIIEPTKEMTDAASPEEIAKWDALALEKAQQLRKKFLASKVDFMDFAREHSEGPGAFRGGDMGVFDRNRMIPAYSEVVFGLKVGEVSPPFKTDKGYFVAKLLGRWPGGVLPQEAVAADLRRNVEERKFREAKHALEQELYRKFPVDNRIYASLGEADEKAAAAAKPDAPEPTATAPAHASAKPSAVETP